MHIPTLLRTASIVLLGSSLIASGADIQWTGATNNNWLDAGNWSPSGVPNDQNARLVFDSSGKNPVIDFAHTGAASATYRYGGFAVSSPYVFNLSGVSAANQLILELGGDGITAPGTLFGNPTINVDAHAVFKVTGNAQLANASISLKANGTFDISDHTGEVAINTISGPSSSAINLGANTLVLGGDNLNALNLQSRITGTEGGGITKVGSGLVMLNNSNNSYTGATIVKSGSLAINGTQGSLGVENRIEANATLFATGTLRGTLINHGVLNANAVSSSSGINTALRIEGNYIQKAGATWMLDIQTSAAGAATRDAITIVGATTTATFEPGSIVAVTPLGSATLSFIFRPHDFGTVLTTTGGIVGLENVELTFPSVSLRPELIQTGNTAKLVLNQLSFATLPGLSENQAAIGAFIDAAYAAAPQYLGNNVVVPENTVAAMVYSLNAQPNLDLLGQAINQFSPQTYQVWFPAAILQAGSIAQAVDNRIQAPRPGAKKDRHLDVFASVSRRSSLMQQDLDLPHAEANSSTFLAGVDYHFPSGTTLGALLAYDETRHELDQAGSSSVSESLVGGVYAGYRGDNLTVNLVGFTSITDDKYESSRNLTRIGQTLAAAATSSTFGSHYGAKLTVSYKIPYRGFDFSPVASLQHLRWDADAFAEENGALFNLRVAEQSATSLRSQLGLRVSRNVRVFRGGSYRFAAFGLWQREFEDDSRGITASFADPTFATGQWTVRTTRPEADSLLLGANVDVDLTDHAQLNLAYTEERGGIVEHSTALSIGLRIQF